MYNIAFKAKICSLFKVKSSILRMIFVDLDFCHFALSLYMSECRKEYIMRPTISWRLFSVNIV